MTDHLADARACLSRVDQAAAHFSAVSWLTATCEHILDHLEAQQTEASLRRGLADITAGRTVDLGSFAQPEPEQLGGEGATSDYTPTAEDVESCFVGEYDPETRSRAFHRWLASIRAEAWDEAATEARDLGWLHDDAHADVVARNPYSKERP